MTATSPRLTIALLGGAGKRGSGLALRWAHAGHSVVIGSRDPALAAQAAAAINATLGREAASDTDNLAAPRAHHLVHLDAEIDCDVLVCADDKAVGDTVVALARESGLGAYYAGVLANSVVAEALTSVLIVLNQRYKVPGAGIRLIGSPND